MEAVPDICKQFSLLELPALKHEATERTAKFTDLIVKHKLLTNGACRVHLQSSELTVKVFDNVEIEGGADISELCFGHDDIEVCYALGLDPVPHSQLAPLLDEEKEMVQEVQQALKNTKGKLPLSENKRDHSTRECNH